MVPDFQQILFFFVNMVKLLIAAHWKKGIDASIANDTKLEADDVGDGDGDAEFVLDD